MRKISFVGLVLAACGQASSPSVNGADATSSAAASTHKVVLKAARTDLVSDQPGAAVVDPNLVNPWGIAFNPAGPAWVSDGGTGQTTVYDQNGGLHLTVAIPNAAGAPSKPTGQVFNNSGAWNGTITDFDKDEFIFVTEDGTIAGWQPGVGVTTRVDNSKTGAVYTGIALGASQNGALPTLYVANFSAGTVETYDNLYRPITLADPIKAPKAGYAPFNIIALEGSSIVVSFAKQDATKTHAVLGAGLGAVVYLSGDGQQISGQNVLSGGVLNAPWGLAVAPPSWGPMAGQLLVGNLGDGHIDFVNLTADAKQETNLTALGALGDATGAPLAIDGLWSLTFAPGLASGASSKLFFTAGGDGGTHGVFGYLNPATLPVVLLLNGIYAPKPGTTCPGYLGNTAITEVLATDWEMTTTTVTLDGASAGFVQYGIAEVGSSTDPEGDFDTVTSAYTANAFVTTVTDGVTKKVVASSTTSISGGVLSTGDGTTCLFIKQ